MPAQTLASMISRIRASVDSNERAVLVTVLVSVIDTFLVPKKLASASAIDPVKQP